MKPCPRLRTLGSLLPALLVISLLLLAPFSGHAQETEATPADTPSTAAPEPRPELASARATMRTFLEAFAPEHRVDGETDLETAASCLDLSTIPSRLHSTQGPELAVQLKDVLDRTRLVDFDEVPEDPAAPPYVFLRQNSGEVVIAPDELGEWRFTVGTVASLQALWRSTEDQKIVEGVTAAKRTGALWLRSRMPESLRRPFLGLEGWQWLGIALLIFVGFVLNRLISAFFQGALLRALRLRLGNLDESLVAGATQPFGLLATAGLWWVGVGWLGLPVKAIGILHNGLSLLVAFALVWAAYRLVDILSAFLAARAARTESRFDDLLIPLLRKSMKFFVTAFGLIFIADNLDLEISSLLAGLGLGGLAFALAAQDTVKNLFGSLTVVLDRPFQVGDWVVIGDVEGTVEELGIRSTRVRTFYNSLITMPNAKLIDAHVDNYGARSYRRWSTILSVTYDTPPEKIDAFCEGVRELIRRHPYTRKDYYHVYFREFGGSSLDIMLYMFFTAPDWATELRERHRLGLDIVRMAQSLGVDFAFPTQTLHLLRGQNPEHETAPGETLFRDHTRDLRQQARDQARSLVASGVGDRVPPPVVVGDSETDGGDG